MRAAQNIEDYIAGALDSSLARPPVVLSKDLNTVYYRKQGRFSKEGLPVHERLKGMKEIYPAFNRDEIIEESKRCFSCGLCFQCNNCLMYCPDNAVNVIQGTGRYTFDLDFCKGCGICSKECPCHYIHMTLE